MVRRLIVAAAVAVASLGANADYIYWNFKDPDGTFAGDINKSSVYVFVSGPSNVNLHDCGTETYGSWYNNLDKMTYTVQSKDEALSKISSILAGEAPTAPLGNVTTTGNKYQSPQTGVKSYYSAIGAASFTAFAIVFDAPDIKDAKNYMLLEDYSVLTGTKRQGDVATTYSIGGYDIVSEAGSGYKTVVFGDRNPQSSSTAGSGTASGTGTKWESIATIPEPTSGVMLLLGVAALALKRKRAA